MTLPVFPSRFEQVEPIASTPLERSYRAVDRLMQREVLLRLPAVEAWSGWNADARTRLLREAQALCKVQHDGVLPVLWVDETDQGVLVVQPPSTGEKLAEHVQQGSMSVDAVVKLGIEVGEALAAVHYAGIVHRGIGLDAVWMQPNGKARLGAFTYAKAFDGKLGGSSLNHGLRKGAEKSAEAALLPPYPAPEQLAGRGADPRADVYALGCLMFRCLAGHDPMLSGDGMQMPDIRAVRKDVPKALGEVVRRCMLVEKTARYPTAQAVVDALKAMQTADAGGRVGSGSKRLGLAAAGLIVAGGIGFALMPGEQVIPQRDQPPLRELQAVGNVYSANYQKGHALLIGIGSAYANAGYFDKLNGPDQEVGKVRDKLLEIDPVTWSPDRIKVLANEQATGQAIRDEIARLKTEAGEEDCVLIYFAGHGVKGQSTRTYHWVCADVDRKDPTQDGARGFLPNSLLDFRAEGALSAKHVLLVADCCHSGRLFEEPLASRGERLEHPKASPHRTSALLRKRTFEFLGSSSWEAAKDCKQGEISQFCQSFLDELSRGAEAKRPMTARELFASIEGRLMAGKSDADQRPVFERLEGEGAFTFFFGDK